MKRYYVEKVEFPSGHEWAVMDKEEGGQDTYCRSRTEARERAKELNSQEQSE